MSAKTAAPSPADHYSAFDQHANSWWDPNGPMRTLHDINPIRLKWIEEHIKQPHAKICDVGCGAGLLSEALAMLGHQVTGLDISQKLIKIARSHSKIHALDIQYIAEHIDQFSPQHTHSFDVITCLELLEHVQNPSAMIAACAQCCRPGGLLFFSTINRNLKSWLGAILAGEHLLGILPKGTHQYDQFIKPSELKRLAQRHQLKLIDVTGLAYNPIDRQSHLSTSLDINYLLCFQKDLAQNA